MTRVAIAAALVFGIAPASAADRTCAETYREFVQRMNAQSDTLSGHRLAFLQRQGLRIYDACDTGHLRNSEARLHALETSSH